VRKVRRLFTTHREPSASQASSPFSRPLRKLAIVRLLKNVRAPSDELAGESLQAGPPGGLAAPFRPASDRFTQGQLARARRWRASGATFLRHASSSYGLASLGVIRPSPTAARTAPIAFAASSALLIAGNSIAFRVSVFPSIARALGLAGRIAAKVQNLAAKRRNVLIIVESRSGRVEMGGFGFVCGVICG
jgi:hypothetical protein